MTRQTWERRNTRGSGYFRRAEQVPTGNLPQSQSALQEIPLTRRWEPAVPAWESAAPAWENNAKGGKGTSDWMSPKGKGDQSGEQQPLIPRRPKHPVIRMCLRRFADGICWYFNTCACAKPNCNREQRTLIGEERNQIPEAFWNKRLDKTASSGQETDSTASARPPQGKGRGGHKGGERERGPKILGCRFVNDGKVCPRGDKCHFVWAHDKPPMGPPAN
jgi:hypothetical protein